jgi:oxaloacetate decarboxylase beta subunit
MTCLLLPSVAPLLGCLMLGNLLRECGVTERLSDTAQSALMNIVTIFLSISVGATTVYNSFLSWETIKIIVLGLLAFCFSTVGGLLLGKLMCWVTKGKINPLIGSAGVSAVPMAARISQLEGQRANPSNFLMMHAMGPNVAGVIGSAVAAGFLLRCSADRRPCVPLNEGKFPETPRFRGTCLWIREESKPLVQTGLAKASPFCTALLKIRIRGCHLPQVSP